MEKDKNADEQERIQEEIMKNAETLLGKNTELNIELVDILEETDKTLEEYKKENEDLRIKVQKAIRQIRDKDEKLKELELEIEVISDEHEEIERKLIDKDRDFSALQKKYEKEKKMNERKESQRDKGIIYHSRKSNRNDDKFTYRLYDLYYEKK